MCMWTKSDHPKGGSINIIFCMVAMGTSMIRKIYTCQKSIIGYQVIIYNASTRASSEEAHTPMAQWFWIELIWTELYTCDEEFFKCKDGKTMHDCQKMELNQTQLNSNINQYFPKQFWCWVNEIVWISVISHSLLYMECRLRLCNCLCRTELILLG